MTTPNKILLRASGVRAFKSCPTKYRLGTIEGLIPDKDTEAQRIGTNWHKMHEVYRKASMPFVAGTVDGVPVMMTEKFDPFDAAMNALNQMYERVPESFDEIAWEVERMILATCFAGHHWLYQDAMETLATEIHFEMPLYHPKTGLPLSRNEVERSGTIDWVTRQGNQISVTDYKSTSRSIDTDSDFWNHLRLDTQISMYVMALQDMHAGGGSEGSMIPGANVDDIIAGAMYDVWHRPTIKPSKLTQAETKAFVETGDYLGSKFEVVLDASSDPPTVTVDGRPAEVERGKKAFAIRETPAMYGARLLADIQQRPGFYFARRAIARTADDIQRFRTQLYSTYQAMKSARDSGHWIQNEHSCDTLFKCPYTSICYHGKVQEIVDGLTPEGFTRSNTPLTIDGNPVEI